MLTVPAVRDNSAMGCPMCQGSQQQNDAPPPTPCWGALEATTLSPHRFPDFKALQTPEGAPWVDPNGGSDQCPQPFWCPGTSVPIRFFLYADHNGVFRWESQRAAPGAETEAGFTNFTSWQSINIDEESSYYELDGETPLKAGYCRGQSDAPWDPHKVHCRDNSLAETSLKVPDDMQAGQTVIRWLWYGAMKTDGTRVTGPEHSLFLNCFDVMIGTPEQCANPPEPCVATTTTTTSTPSGPHTCGGTGGCLCSPGMNNGGHNMLDHAIVTSGETECCDRCQQTEGCVGWTFIGGSGNECWLKDQVDDMYEDGSVTSGAIVDFETSV